MVLTALAFQLAPDTAASSIDGTWLTPSFLTSLAILITAITGLVVALRTQKSTTQTALTVETNHQTAKETQADMKQVKAQTNGANDLLMRHITQLEAALTALGAPVPHLPPAAPSASASHPGAPSPTVP